MAGGVSEAGGLPFEYRCGLTELGGRHRDAGSAARHGGSEHKQGARSRGVLFVHRFGAALNVHLHMPLCVLDGVVAQRDESCAERVLQGVRQRVLGLCGIDRIETEAKMQGWCHSGGFSLQPALRVPAQDRAVCGIANAYCKAVMKCALKLTAAAC